MSGGLGGPGKVSRPAWPPSPWLAPPCNGSGQMGGHGASGQVCACVYVYVGFLVFMCAQAPARVCKYVITWFSGCQDASLILPL